MSFLGSNRAKGKREGTKKNKHWGEKSDTEKWKAMEFLGGFYQSDLLMGVVLDEIESQDFS